MDDFTVDLGKFDFDEIVPAPQEEKNEGRGRKATRERKPRLDYGAEFALDRQDPKPIPDRDRGEHDHIDKDRDDSPPPNHVKTSGMPASLATSFETIPPPNAESEYKRKQTLLTDAPTPSSRAFGWVREVNETEVREALLKEVKKHSCWRAKAVDRLVIEDIKCFSCLHYTLESFTESRSVSKATEPYSIGHFIESGGFSKDMSDASFLADVWSLPCEPNADFAEETRVFEIPGSSELCACSSCSAEGVSHCFHCRGQGTDQCKYCRGTGMKAGIPHPAVYTHPMMGQPHLPGSQPAVLRQGGAVPMSYGKGTPMHYMNVSGMPPPGIGTQDICFFCHGRGIQECGQCNGQGKKSCGPCGGSGSVRQYLKLKIKFGIERSEFFHQEGGVPEDLIRQASGEVILAEQNPHVLPLRKHPVDAVNDNSKRLLSIHLQKCLGSCKMLQQRHTLEAVPIAEVLFKLGSKSGKFWVYGLERLCFVPKYPSKCVIL